MGLDEARSGVAEGVVGVVVERGFEGFDAVEEGGHGGMRLALRVMVLSGKVEILVGVVLLGGNGNGNRVWLGLREE